MRKFIKTNVARPKLSDALEYIKKGSFTVGREHYVSPKERIKEVKGLWADIQKLLKREIPKSRNLDLVILKCHLLVEFMMNQFITLSAKHKFDVSKERFTFAQKLSLIHAFGFRLDPIILPSIEVLNSLRNQVAHTLLLNRALIDTLLKINSEDPDSFTVSGDNERAQGVKSITRFICANIMAAISAHHDTAYEDLSNTKQGAAPDGKTTRPGELYR